MTFTEMDHVGASTMINRMTTDVNQVQTGINMVLRLFLRSPFIVFGAMIMAFTVNAKAALVFVVVIPVLSVIVFGIMLVTIPLYKNVQGQLDNVLEKTRENLAGIRLSIQYATLSALLLPTTPTKEPAVRKIKSMVMMFLSPTPCAIISSFLSKFNSLF